MASAGDKSRIKAVFFDLMGTCLDWHTGIVNALPGTIPEQERSKLAIDWREEFFDEIAERFQANLPPEDIDDTHRRTLARILLGQQRYLDLIPPKTQEQAVQAWHSMSAWPEVSDALAKLREKHEIFVLANGTTRLQLDLTKSSRLQFNMLFSSELLGLTKPAPEIYQKAMDLVSVTPQQCVMVAAHAYDLRAAKAVGMTTIYVRRWTEDTRESMEQVKAENNHFLEDMSELALAIEQYENT